MVQGLLAVLDVIPEQPTQRCWHPVPHQSRVPVVVLVDSLQWVDGMSGQPSLAAHVSHDCAYGCHGTFEAAASWTADDLEHTTAGDETAVVGCLGDDLAVWKKTAIQPQQQIIHRRALPTVRVIGRVMNYRTHVAASLGRVHRNRERIRSRVVDGRVPHMAMILREDVPGETQAAGARRQGDLACPRLRGDVALVMRRCPAVKVHGCLALDHQSKGIVMFCHGLVRRRSGVEREPTETAMPAVIAWLTLAAWP